mgnify:CR=1 FL=1
MFTLRLGLFFSALAFSVLAEAVEPDFETLRDETFEAAWSQVGASYYDASFGGLDWDEVGARYRARLPQAETMAELRVLISEMLYQLGDSHLALIAAGSDPAGLVKPWTLATRANGSCFIGWILRGRRTKLGCGTVILCFRSKGLRCRCFDVCSERPDSPSMF